LGMAQLQLGDKAEGRTNLDQAVAAGIPDELAKQAKDAIVQSDNTADSTR